jgi:hypothetical protein
MTITYWKNAAATSHRTDVGMAILDRTIMAILDRTIGDLILGLDIAADHIPPDYLGGTNEAIAAISAAVDFLDELRRQWRGDTAAP